MLYLPVVPALPHFLYKRLLQPICPLKSDSDCGANRVIGADCTCIAGESNTCTNTCQAGQAQKASPDCSCYTCPPDISTFFEGSVWDGQSCSWSCPSGLLPSVGEDNKLKCATTCSSDLQCGTGKVCENGTCKAGTDMTVYYICGGALLLMIVLGGSVFGFKYLGRKGGRRK